MANQQDNICPICKLPMGEPHDHGDTHRPISTTHCQRPHTFGRTCLQRWQQENDNCPVCRQEQPFGGEILAAEDASEFEDGHSNNAQPTNARLTHPALLGFLYGPNDAFWTPSYSTGLPSASREALRFLQRAEDLFVEHVRLLQPPIDVPSARTLESDITRWNIRLWFHHPNWQRSSRGQIFRHALALYRSRITGWDNLRRGPVVMEVHGFLNHVRQLPGWFPGRLIFEASALLEAVQVIRRHLGIASITRLSGFRISWQVREDRFSSAASRARLSPSVTTSTQSASSSAAMARLMAQHNPGHGSRLQQERDAAVRSIRHARNLRASLARDQERVRRDSIGLARERFQRAQQKEQEQQKEREKRDRECRELPEKLREMRVQQQPEEEKHHEELKEQVGQTKQEVEKKQKQPKKQKKQKASEEQKQPEKQKAQEEQVLHEQKQCGELEQPEELEQRDELEQHEEPTQPEGQPDQNGQPEEQNQPEEVPSEAGQHPELITTEDIEMRDISSDEAAQQHEEPYSDEDVEMRDVDQDDHDEAVNEDEDADQDDEDDLDYEPDQDADDDEDDDYEDEDEGEDADADEEEQEGLDYPEDPSVPNSEAESPVA